MDPLQPYVDAAWKVEEEYPSDAAMFAREAEFHSFPPSSSPSSGPRYPDTPPSTTVNQVNFDPIGVEDPSSVFLTSNSILDPSEFGVAFASLDLAAGQVSWVPSGPEYGSGPALTEEPVMNNVTQTNDEISWCFPLSSFEISYPANPSSQTLSFVQDVEDSFQTNASPHAIPSEGIPPFGRCVGQQEIGFSSENLTFHRTDHAVEIDGPSFPLENIDRVDLETNSSPRVIPSEGISPYGRVVDQQEIDFSFENLTFHHTIHVVGIDGPSFPLEDIDRVDLETNANPYAIPSEGISPYDRIVNQEIDFSSENLTSHRTVHVVGIDGPSFPSENVYRADLENPSYVGNPSFEQQPVLSMDPPRHCEWKEADGTVCGELLTCAILPGHLSKHGIKNMSRNRPTKCNWVGCKKKKPMNRESISRHIREVHLCKRRASKRAQKLVPMAQAHRPDKAG